MNTHEKAIEAAVIAYAQHILPYDDRARMRRAVADFMREVSANGDYRIADWLEKTAKELEQP